MEQKDNEKRNSLDIKAMQEKWGVSAEEIKEAIANVGYKPSKIEEYLVNHRWSNNRDEQVPFQKRELNEDETY